METINILVPDCSAKAALNIALCIKNAHGECRVIGASTKRNSPAKFSRFFDKIYVIDDKNEVDDLLDIVFKEKVHVLFPTAERDITLITQNLDCFLPHCRVAATPTMEQITQTTDKWLFYRKMIRRGIPTPKSMLIPAGKMHVENLQYPLISKPLKGTGGMQVVRIDDLEMLKGHLKDCQENRVNFLLQEYIEGYDVDCSVLCKNGEILAYTIQKDIEPSRSDFKPSKSIQFIFDKDVFKLAREVMAALKFNGVAHIDLRYDEKRKRFVVIEVNPRYWATMLGSYSAGVNFPCLAVQSALEMEFECPAYEERKFMRLSNWLKKIPAGTAGPIKDTNLKYLLQDPLPRLINKFSSKKS